jgi:hypothetical protein
MAGIASGRVSGWFYLAIHQTPTSTKGDLYLVRELPLLFGTRIAVDSVWPNSHRACVHLLLNISLLESPSNLIMSEFAPPVCFSEPLPAVFGVNFRALATQHLHSAATCNVAHGVSSIDLVAGNLRPV